MSSAAVWAIVAFSVVETVVVVAVVRAAIGAVWRPLMEAYPARAPGEGAVRRAFQSYRVGIVNLGGSVHTTVDSEFLHLEPAALVRVFGIGPVSVPWEGVEPVRLRGKRYAEVRIASHVVRGPRWALEMAFAAGDDRT